MPKKKQFLTAKKSAAKRNHVSGPETANEFLSAGVDFEEAGEKWRAGDAAKSSRFFVRAIENYEVGLQRFPQSFDLAYNKARLQYEVAQQPRILAQLPASLLDWLQLALRSHKVALEINQDSADLLFNTAQVLTSLAEASTEGRTASDESRGEALHMFQEALKLFQSCLQMQELEYTQTVGLAGESIGSINANQDGDNEMMGDSASDASADGSWAAIIEPVTKDTLLDTIIAQLDTLTAICNLIGSPGATEPSWIEKYHRTTIRDKITAYSPPNDPARQQELILTTAKFTCALADAGFRTHQLDLAAYEHELNAAFPPSQTLSQNPQALCDLADAELAFSASIHAAVPHSPGASSNAALRWTHLTRALNALSTAAALLHAQNLPRIHLRRGDCELLRRGLARRPLLYDVAVRSAATLLRNAEVYYRGAAAVARSERVTYYNGDDVDDEDVELEALAKEAVACALRGDDSKVDSLQAGTERGGRGLGIGNVVDEMRDEGLVGGDELRDLGF